MLPGNLNNRSVFVVKPVCVYLESKEMEPFGYTVTVGLDFYQ